jgi:hypothetical protein
VPDWTPAVTSKDFRHRTDVGGRRNSSPLTELVHVRQAANAAFTIHCLTPLVPSPRTSRQSLRAESVQRPSQRLPLCFGRNNSSKSCVFVMSGRHAAHDTFRSRYKSGPCSSVLIRGPCSSVFIRVYPCLSVFLRVYPCFSVVRVYPWSVFIRGLEGLADAEVEPAPLLAGTGIKDESIVGPQQDPPRS